MPYRRSDESAASPSAAKNDFRIGSIELVNGNPKVVWEPKTNRWTGAEIQAVLNGGGRRVEGG